MSIKLLASKCSISPQTISNIEKDRNFPSISTINILSKELNSSNDYLLQLSNLPEDNIGQTIKKYRLKKGMTQEDLAKKCNLHKSTIKDYEDNRIKNETETLKKIYFELNIKK